MAPYDKDLIAMRDNKSKLFSSVVKWWMVNYVTPEMLAAQEAEEKERILREHEAEEKADNLDEEIDETMRLALEISARLEAEAAADEAAKQAEIQAAMAAASGEVQLDDSDYNATTGSYSGGYGKNVTLDEAGLDQVASILSGSPNNFDNLFDKYSE